MKNSDFFIILKGCNKYNMSDKKILLCEDSEIDSMAYSLYFTDKGFDVSVLASTNNPNYILKNLKRKIEEENPDFVLIDGLEGECFKAIEIIPKRKNILPIIFSGDDDLVYEAKEKGYKAFNKIERDVLAEFLENYKN